MAKEASLNLVSEYSLNNPDFLVVENRPVQYFSEAYIEECKKMSLEEIVEKISEQQNLFWNLHGNNMNDESILISLKISKNLLLKYKTLCENKGFKYQTQIKKLILNWIISEN